MITSLQRVKLDQYVNVVDACIKSLHMTAVQVELFLLDQGFTKEHAATFKASVWQQQDARQATATARTSLNQAQLLSLNLLCVNEGFKVLGHMSGVISVELFCAALVHVVSRHAVLRTTYAFASDGSYAQHIHSVPCGELFQYCHASSAIEANESLQADANKGFHLVQSESSPVRCTFVRVNTQDPFDIVQIHVHPVAFDCASIPILLAELSTLYCCSGGTVMDGPLQELPMQYASFGTWQRDHFESEQRAIEEYWREHLHEGVLPVLDLPLDYARPAVLTHRLDVIPIEFDFSFELQALMAAHRATRMQLVLAAWSILLCWHTGQQDMVIGLPYHGRCASGSEALIGPFVNMLGVRMEASRGQGTLDTVIRCACDVSAKGMQHAAPPFQHIVSELLPLRSRDTSRNAIFQTTLAWGAEADERNISNTAVSLGSAGRMRIANIQGHCLAKPDAMLFVVVGTSGCITGGVEFNANLLTSSSATLLAAHFQALAKVIADAPGQASLLDIMLMPSDEVRSVLWRFNDTSGAFPRVHVHEVVSAQAAHTPDAHAVEWQRITMGYATLLEHADVLSQWLRAHSLAVDAVVALELHRSLGLVYGILGVLLAAGAYLPLDPTWPEQRILTMVEDSASGHVVAQHDCTLAASLSGAVVLLDDSHPGPLLERERATLPATLVYVIYTSGTTGRPKGVPVCHDGEVNLVCGIRHRCRAFCSWRCGIAFHHVFDGFQMALFWCLAVLGGACFLLESGLSLASIEETDKLTHLHGVHSAMSLAKATGDIRHVQVGGEAATAALVANFPPPVSIWNDYGPTEVTCVSVAKRIDVSRISSIGCPTRNSLCLVVNIEDGCSGPRTSMQIIGVWGELWLGGVQVTRGYLQRPEKTADAFIAHPWTTSDPSGHGVAYRTGDRVRWYADGEVEFGGRIDFQVKLRGQRLELGEIEHALCSQSGVVEAVVLLVKHLDALVAYVSPARVVSEMRDGASTTDAHPFAHVASVACARDALPAYMVPSVVIGVDRWPRTSSGKIDRKRLPPPDLRVEATTISAPRNEEETAVRSIFASVLSLDADSVSVDTSIFEMGATSLDGVRLARQLSTASGCDVPPVQVFDHPTVAGLASSVAAIRERATDSVEAEGGCFTTTKYVELHLGLPDLPCSSMQHQLLLHHEMQPMSTAYNEPILIPCCTGVSVDQVRASLQTLSRRHAVLRTSYAINLQSAKFTQRVLCGDGHAVPLASCSHSSSWEDELDAELHTPFSLYAAPPIRALYLPAETPKLVVNVHHVSADMEALNIVRSEVQAYCSALASRLPPQLNPSPDLEYADFVAWEHTNLHNEALSWWITQLEGAPTLLDMPRDRSRPSLQSSSARRANVQLEVDLKLLCSYSRSTANSVLLSLWAELLLAHSGQADVVIGVPHSMRYVYILMLPSPYNY